MASVVIAGVCKDVGHVISREIEYIKSIFDTDELKKIVIIESDSSDNTITELDNLASSDDRIFFKSAGALSDILGHRSERIAYCRNLYIEILNLNKYYGADYLIVMDLDGVNNMLNKESIKRSLSFMLANKGVAVTANQLYKYYDIWALRHKDWCNDDCWYSFAKLKNVLPIVQAHSISNLSKMINIPTDAMPIEVDSAFGGFAIYNIEYIADASYKGFEEIPVCEHVHFSRIYRKNGGRIYILPFLINHDKSIHVENAESFHLSFESDSVVDFS